MMGAARHKGWRTGVRVRVIVRLTIIVRIWVRVRVRVSLAAEPSSASGRPWGGGSHAPALILIQGRMYVCMGGSMISVSMILIQGLRSRT